MATIGSIKIRIGADIQSMQRSLKKAERSLQRSGRKLTEMGNRISAAVTLPIIAIGAASLKTAGDFEALEKGMESMMGSAEAARAEIALLRKEALKPGLNYEQALKGSVRLQAVQVDAELARRALAGFGNALALVGGTGEQLDGVTLALSQIAAKGKISAEEINQLAERVPQIRQILKDAFGTADTEKLQKLGIGFEEFVTKAIIELEKLPQAQSGIKNSIENTKLALQEASAIIGKKLFPVFEKIANVVVKLATAFGNLPDGLQTNIIQFGLLAAAAGPVLSIMGSLKLVAASLTGVMASLSGSMATLFAIQGNGLPIGAALVKTMQVLKTAFTASLPIIYNTGKAFLFVTGKAIAGLGQSLLFLSGSPIQATKTALVSLKASVINLSKSILLSASISFQVAKANIIEFGKSLLALSANALKSAKVAMTSLMQSLLLFAKNLTTVNSVTLFNFSKNLVFISGTALVNFGKNLVLFAANPIQIAKTAIVAATASFSRFGKTLLIAAGNPIKALKVGLLSIQATLATITIPFGLIVAAIAAFGVVVAANIGPARKKFVELANTFISLYNESTAFRFVVEGLGLAFKSLYSIAKGVLQGIWEGIKGIGSAIVAIFKGDLDGLRKALLGGFSGVKNSLANIGTEIGESFNDSLQNTFGDRPPIEFITEKDVDKTINKAAKLAQSIQDKLFGVTTPDIDTSAFSDLSNLSFNRNANAKGTKGKGSSDSESVDRHQFDRTFGKDAFSLGADSLSQLSILPEGLVKHVEKVNELGESYKRMREGFSETVNKFNEGFASIIDNGIQDALIGIGDTLGNVLAGNTKGISLLGTVLESFAGIMIEVGKLAITTGIAIEGIRKALQTLNPIAAIAGGVALVALGTFVRSKAKNLGQPKLAKGGLAFGETLATVGDNFNAAVDPEVIAPLSKLNDMLTSTLQGIMPQSFELDTSKMNQLRKNISAGGNIKLDGEFRILGTDLVLAVDKAKQQNYRTSF